MDKPNKLTASGSQGKSKAHQPKSFPSQLKPMARTNKPNSKPPNSPQQFLPISRCTSNRESLRAALNAFSKPLKNAVPFKNTMKKKAKTKKLKAPKKKAAKFELGVIKPTLLILLEFAVIAIAVWAMSIVGSDNQIIRAMADFLSLNIHWFLLAFALFTYEGYYEHHSKIVRRLSPVFHAARAAFAIWVLLSIFKIILPAFPFVDEANVLYYNNFWLILIVLFALAYVARKVKYALKER